MSNNEKIATAVVAAALTLFLLITGVSQGWAVWLWLPLGLIPPVAALLATRAIGQNREQQRMRQEFLERSVPQPPAPEPERPRQEMLSNVPLNSAVPDYRFLLSGTVYWLPQSNEQTWTHHNPGALARDAIVSRATEILRNEQPEDHSALTERMNAVLGASITVPQEHIEAWGSNISVELPEADQKRLHRLAEVRKEEETWEHERNHEHNVREYLGDDVLRNPGRAVVWWLARHNEDEDSGLQATVNSIDDLRTLTSAAHATDIPEWKAHEPGKSEPVYGVLTHSPNPTPGYTFPPFGNDETSHRVSTVDSETPSKQEESPTERLLAFVEDAMASCDGDERAMFVRRMSQLLEKHGMHGFAMDLRRRFDVNSHADGARSEPTHDGGGDNTEGLWSDASNNDDDPEPPEIPNFA